MSLFLILVLTSCAHRSASPSLSTSFYLRFNGREFSPVPLNAAETTACVKKRMSAFEKIDPLSALAARELKTHIPPFPEAAVSAVLVCQSDLIKGLKGLEIRPEEVAEFEREKDRMSKYGDVLAFHELVHLIGGIGDYYTETVSPENQAFYRYFTGKPSAPYARVSFFKELPPIREIDAKLEGLNFLTHRKKYISGASENSFYILLDEWNAYALTTKIEDKVTRDKKCRDGASRISALEFEVFVSVYLDHIKRQYSALYPRVVHDVSLRHFIRSLSKKTARAITECPRLRETMPELIEEYARSKSAIENHFAH